MEIDEIAINPRSMNKGTLYGMGLIRHSIKSLGLTKSIVVDKNNTVLCGNHVFYLARELNAIRNIKVIETTGDTLVVIKRIDVDAKTKKGLEISLVDNFSVQENLEWDADSIQRNMNETLSFNPNEWGAESCCIKRLDIETLLNDNVQMTSKPLKERSFREPVQLSLFKEDDF